MKDKYVNTMTIGITYQMSIDAFINNTHKLHNTKDEQYEKALDILQQISNYRSSSKRKQLALTALQLCDECLETYLILATLYEDVFEKLECYRKGVEKATLQLGKDYFKQTYHDFYQEETALFFDLKYAYACTLFDNGFFKRAKHHFREIVMLNPSDHYHVHEYLYALYLYFEEYEELKRLFEKYKADSTLNWFCLLLFHYKRQNCEEATTCIHKIKKHNVHLFEYLTNTALNTSLYSTNYLPSSKEEASHIYSIFSCIIYSLHYLATFLQQNA